MRFHESVHGVYFDDLDALGILHNARYLLLLERTIGAFWQRLGWSGLPDPRANPDQFHLVKANHIEHTAPFGGVGEVRVRVWIEALGRTSMKFGFRILPMDEDQDLAHGYRVLVCVDPQTRKPTPWTDAFRKRVAPYVVDASAPGGG